MGWSSQPLTVAQSCFLEGGWLVRRNGRFELEQSSPFLSPSGQWQSLYSTRPARCRSRRATAPALRALLSCRRREGEEEVRESIIGWAPTQSSDGKFTSPLNRPLSLRAGSRGRRKKTTQKIVPAWRGSGVGGLLNTVFQEITPSSHCRPIFAPFSR